MGHLHIVIGIECGTIVPNPDVVVENLNHRALDQEDHSALWNNNIGTLESRGQTKLKIVYANYLVGKF